MDISEREPLDRIPKAERDQSLLEELGWSAALIGAVIVYLMLVAQFAS